MTHVMVTGINARGVNEIDAVSMEGIGGRVGWAEDG
jgi:hypothetical protein